MFINATLEELEIGHVDEVLENAIVREPEQWYPPKSSANWNPITRQGDSLFD